MHNSPKLLFIILITSLFTSTVNAAPNLSKSKIIVPDSIPGVVTLDAASVIEKVMNIPNQIIIDARIKTDRKHGYLEDSISLPNIDTTCETLSAIVHNKSAPLIFYCNGVKCGRSVVSIKVAKACGYTNLSWFKGGFEEWKDKGYQYSKDR